MTVSAAVLLSLVCLYTTMLTAKLTGTALLHLRHTPWCDLLWAVCAGLQWRCRFHASSHPTLGTHPCGRTPFWTRCSAAQPWLRGALPHVDAHTTCG